MKYLSLPKPWQVDQDARERLALIEYIKARLEEGAHPLDVFEETRAPLEVIRGNSPVNIIETMYAKNSLALKKRQVEMHLAQLMDKTVKTMLSDELPLSIKDLKTVGEIVSELSKNVEASSINILNNVNTSQNKKKMKRAHGGVTDLSFLNDSEGEEC
jgi:hypothetical protein